MTTYKAIPYEGQWVVRIGWPKKDKSFRYTGKWYTTEAEAAAVAAHLNAEAMIDKLFDLVEQMSLTDAKRIGVTANHLIDKVVDRCREEDPEHDEYDARGWLA